MRNSLWVVVVAALVSGCGGGGNGSSPASAAPPASSAAAAPVTPPCTATALGSERWPAWDPGTKFAAKVATARQEYRSEVQDWKIYYQPGGYVANGEYVTLSSFATLGPDTRYDSQGVPQVLHQGEWVYNPVTIANFALYHHTLNLRGQPMAPAFWSAVAKLQAMQGSDGALRYTYAFETMPPGWASAMAQGQALSVFARAYLLSKNEAYVQAGNAALQYLLKPVEEGGVRGSLRDIDPSLANYTSLFEYSLALSPHTLNGFIFTIFGLYDWAMLGVSTQNKAVLSDMASSSFNCSVHTVASTVHYYDIGGFSAYDLRQILGAPEPAAGATYHKIHIAQLVALYSIARRPELLRWAKVWADGVGQPIP